MHVLTRSFAARPNRGLLSLLPLLACLCTPLAAQVNYATPYTFSILAGSPGFSGSSDGTGTAAGFGQPYGLAIDSKGNVYVADRKSSTIRMMTPAGVVTTIAGLVDNPGTTDGAKTVAQFNLPSGLAVDGSGNLYVADTQNNTIRKVTSAGVVSTLAGIAGSSGSTDTASGVKALFNLPYSIAIDSGGNLYVADFGNNTIRKVTSAGVVTTLAGTAGSGGSTDGSGTAALFNQPASITIDSSGNLYVADSSNSTIRKVTSTGVVSTVAGTATLTGDLDGVGQAALFSSPRGITVDSSDNLYVADSGNSTIRKITPAGVVTTLAGIPGDYSETPGTGQNALFDVPIGIVVNTTGTLYVSSELAYVVAQGTVATAVVPTFTEQPSGVTIASGSTVVFRVQSFALPAASYQWYLNGVALTGANQASLLVSGATAANAGDYTCVASNASGSTVSSAATLKVSSTTDVGRLINISCRSQVETINDILIAGFAVGGAGTSGSQNLLIRASGPALYTDFGLLGTLADPQLQLFSGATPIAYNAGWGGTTAIENADKAVDAFEWVNITSLDSALIEDLASGPYTAQVSGETGDTGIALVEVFDATPAGTYTAATPRITNISARAYVGTDGGILIAGFVIGGSTARTVLIRASGPSLAQSPINLSGVLPDPELQLYRSNGDGSSTLLSTSAAWGGDPSIVSAAASVGAFTWQSASSADSAQIVTLPPGDYTAEVSGITNDTGIALVEVYEIP